MRLDNAAQASPIASSRDAQPASAPAKAGVACDTLSSEASMGLPPRPSPGLEMAETLTPPSPGGSPIEASGATAGVSAAALRDAGGSPSLAAARRSPPGCGAAADTPALLALRLDERIERLGRHRIWHGACDSGGSPIARFRGRRERDRRLAWLLRYGAFPATSLIRTCDYMTCVAPECHQPLPERR